MYESKYTKKILMRSINNDEKIIIFFSSRNNWSNIRKQCWKKLNVINTNINFWIKVDIYFECEMVIFSLQNLPLCQDKNIVMFQEIDEMIDKVWMWSFRK